MKTHLNLHVTGQCSNIFTLAQNTENTENLCVVVWEQYLVYYVVYSQHKYLFEILVWHIREHPQNVNQST